MFSTVKLKTPQDSCPVKGLMIILTYAISKLQFEIQPLTSVYSLIVSNF